MIIAFLTFLFYCHLLCVLFFLMITYINIWFCIKVFLCAVGLSLLSACKCEICFRFIFIRFARGQTCCRNVPHMSPKIYATKGSVGVQAAEFPIWSGIQILIPPCPAKLPATISNKILNYILFDYLNIA